MYVIFWDWLFKGSQFLKSGINIWGGSIKAKRPRHGFYFLYTVFLSLIVLTVFFQPMFAVDFFGSFKIYIDL